MMTALVLKLSDPKFLVMIFAAIAAAAAVLTLAMPYLETDRLQRRMRDVSVERDQIRARERERLGRGGGSNEKVSLRYAPKAQMKQVVDQFNLDKWLGTETAKVQLNQAGYRGPQAEVAFLFFRLVMPIICLISAAFYSFVLWETDQGALIKGGIVIAGAYIGIKAPEIFLKNKITKRQASMRMAFPDALDLLLICVEAGMSLEHAFRKVALEIGSQSVPLAEELSLTTAELSYLPDRRKAFENFATRTGLEVVKSVSTALVQAEKYGTPLGQALRVLAQEGRDERMNAAEKKAAALPPKLTVPMIAFFLPVLIIVIITPALIQVFEWN
ncbi:type II secretion system F family protein [Alsobacter sp. KACC 23698]|uniref:Type II secretion system F family protein n=1 Tax=Alsobacter sp. KACC 23698 TaxID=3149229 RepID=A0AAU7JGK2_9HYPH